VLNSRFAANDVSIPIIDLKHGQVGEIFVDLGTSTVHRPMIEAFSHDNTTEEIPGFSFVNDELLGSGTGDSTLFHASSVRFGVAVPRATGTQLRVENAANLQNLNDDPTNLLQLSFRLRYVFSRNEFGDDIIRFELIGTAGVSTAVGHALPVRVHANFVYPADLSGFRLKLQSGKFISLVTHTLLGL
jgi:hypothetical protein